MRKIALLSLLILLHCNDSVVKCPTTTATPSNLAISPSPLGTIAVHPHGIHTTWEWQLTGTLNTVYEADVYDVDLFETSAEQIASIKNKNRKVICYFSAGSSEDYRNDFDSFDENVLGKPLQNWEGERWLDIRSQNVLEVMEARMDLAVTKGCNGVEFDNMDAFQQDTCFSISKNEQLAYNRNLANMAHNRGLTVAQKNNPDLVEDLIDYYDLVLTEECYFYNECEKYFPYIARGRPVINVEYNQSYREDPGQSLLCQYSNNNNLQTMVLDLALDDSYHHTCF